MSSPLDLSPQAEVSVAHFGEERQPLLEVTGALPDPEAVIDIAARHRFGQHGPFYPGLRAPVSEAISMPLVAPLLGYLVDAFTLSRAPRYCECFLSVVTHAPGSLAPIQRLPHFDGVEPERLAVLLYLDRTERGGTAFYRQRATGFESVDADRFEAYRTSLEAEIARTGLPDPQYIAGDTDTFVQTHRIDGWFNSLVVYRGNTLHCACLPRDFAPDPDPRSGRLTLNLFLD
jgi:hypothetical protein